jgi:predicted nucleic acid-binding protein
LLEVVLQLPYAFCLPDAIGAELEEPPGGHLLEIGYTSIQLPPEQIELAVELSNKYPKASRGDIFALVSAKYVSCVLLTGDQVLRLAAENENVEVHGTLWLIDALLSEGFISTQLAVQALHNIMESGGRLPRKEVESRLKGWQK